MFRLAAAPLLLLAACGLTDGRSVSNLDADDIAALCAELSAEPRTVSCAVEGGASFDIQVIADETACVSSFPQYPEDCVATVGDLRACNEAKLALTDEEICAGTAPDECLPSNDLSCQIVGTSTTPLTQ